VARTTVSNLLSSAVEYNSDLQSFSSISPSDPKSYSSSIIEGIALLSASASSILITAGKAFWVSSVRAGSILRSAAWKRPCGWRFGSLLLEALIVDAARTLFGVFAIPGRSATNSNQHNFFVCVVRDLSFRVRAAARGWGRIQQPEYRERRHRRLRWRHIRIALILTALVGIMTCLSAAAASALAGAVRATRRFG
jgi:hypothetical protein